MKKLKKKPDSRDFELEEVQRPGGKQRQIRNRLWRERRLLMVQIASFLKLQTHHRGS